MAKQVPVAFKNRRGLTLRGVLHVPKEYATAVVFLHGFPATMEGTAKRFSAALAKRGYLSFRFDFSGSGSSEGTYEDKLMSEEVKDVRAAIDFLAKEYRFTRLVLIGHSTGAIDAALYAHTDKRVRGLVLAGAVSHLDQAARYDFTDRQVRDFWTKGWTHHPPLAKQRERKKRKPRRWAPPKKGKLNKAFYDEFFTLDVPAAVRKYRRPLLILHGERDAAIPVSKDPRELYALAHRPKRLVVVPGADHSFKKRGTQKPAIDAVARFIRSVR